MSRNDLEISVLEGNSPFQMRGDARAEIVRRDRDYAEAQEQSRREFEMAMFNAEGERDVKRKQFEEALAQRQMDHAAALAKEHLGAAQSAAKAARLAAWATHRGSTRRYRTSGPCCIEIERLRIFGAAIPRPRPRRTVRGTLA
jgi:hypothetical protein